MTAFALLLVAVLSSMQTASIAEECLSDTYKVYIYEERSWQDASEACNTTHQTLAVVKNTQQARMAKDCFSRLSTVNKFWIGLWYNGSVGSFVWSDGKQFECDSELMLIFNCSRTPSEDWCVLLIDERLVLQNCSRPHNHICQSLPNANGIQPAATSETVQTSLERVSSSFDQSQHHKTVSFVQQDFGVNTINTRVSQPLPSIQLTSHVSTPRETDVADESVSASNISRELPPNKTSDLSSSHVSPSPAYLQTVIGKTKYTGVGFVSPAVSSSHEVPGSSSSISLQLSILQLKTTEEETLNPLCDKKKSCSSFFVEKYSLRIQALDASKLSSLQEAVNLTAELFEGIAPRSPGANVNLLTSTRDLEQFSLKYAKNHLNANESSTLTLPEKSFTLIVQRAPTDHGEDLIIPLMDDNNDTEVLISLPSSLFHSSETFVTVLLYKNTSMVLSRQAQMSFHGQTLKGGRIGSLIVGISIDPYPQQALQKESITMVFKHGVASPNLDKVHCVFWDFSHSTPFNGSWASEGCHVINTTATKTVCSCDHMTNFAVLMQTGDTEIPMVHRLALTTITYTGCALSLLGEASTIFAYVFVIGLQKDEARIRFNLILSIALAQVVFLSGIKATFHKSVCIFVAILLHYLFLVSFGWMSVEGFTLYFKVVKVFNAHMKLRFLGLLAWSIPFLIVLLAFIITYTTHDDITRYVSEDFCWISSSNHLIWAFIAPVLLVVLINVVITGAVIREMVKLQPVNSSDSNYVRQTLKAFVTLFPLLGFTWLFGVLTVTDTGLIFQYLFAFLNSLQGFFIFLLNVVRSSELRFTLRRRTMSWSLNPMTWFHLAEMASNAKNRELGKQPTKNKDAPIIWNNRNIQVYPVSAE